MFSKAKLIFNAVFKSSAIIESGMLLKPVLFIYNLISKQKLISKEIISIHDVANLGIEKLCLYPSTKFKSVSPKELNVESLPSELIQIPQLSLYKFDSVIVNAHSSAIILDKKIIVEKIDEKERFNEGFIFWHGSKKALIFNFALEEIEEGFFLGGNGAWNWYHWLIEILPKILFSEQSNVRTILISKHINQIPTFYESLQLLLPKNIKLVFLDAEKNYKVKKLTYINNINYVKFNYFTGASVGLTDAYFRPNLLLSYVNNIKAKTLDAKPYKSYNKNIYLARRDRRIAENDDEIEKLLCSYGFESLCISDFSFVEQVNIFHNADFIVGTSGAAWSNLIFANDKTKALCFMDATARNFSCFSNLAAIFGVELTYSFYNGSGEINDHEKNGFTVNVEEIKDVMENKFFFTSIKYN